jgi:glycosyltransferase involved in cell wall biosynthesis
MKKICIVTDAWEPQVNGVVRTYQNICKQLNELNIEHIVLNPNLQGFKTIPMPGYNEISLVINPWKLFAFLDKYMKNGYVFHIATEGPLGLFARIFCQKNGLTYTTSFHTLFPEFIKAQHKIPTFLTYPYFRWFHKKSVCVMVPTKNMLLKLTGEKFSNLKLWTRGVDSKIFHPNYSQLKDKQPYLLCVSRISKEKGLDDFCKLNYPRKVLIGDGPYLQKLKQKYDDVEFLGKKEGKELATWFANAEAFVFPSKTDTFGIVLLESISCGTPFIAYDEPGPKEVIEEKINGIIVDDLQKGIDIIATFDREKVYNSSIKWTWQKSAKQFLENIYGHV